MEKKQRSSISKKNQVSKLNNKPHITGKYMSSSEHFKACGEKNS